MAARYTPVVPDPNTDPMTQAQLRVDHADGGLFVRFYGDVSFRSVVSQWRRARKELDRTAGPVTFDFMKATSVDGGMVALVLELSEELRAEDRKVEFLQAEGKTVRLFDFFNARTSTAPPKPPPQREGVLSQVGRVTENLFTSVIHGLTYLGDVTYGFLRSLRHPRTVNWGDLWRLMERTGADGVPIVMLINFLVGVALGMQGAIQLHQYGGDVFLADFVGIVVTRSLAPLMTAIIVAGRSGAAFAAEIGTMKVSEEIDALRTMHIDPVRYLVLPRILALGIVVPLLSVLADMMAVGGGLLMGMTMLEIPPEVYLERTQQALSLNHVLTGLTKSLFFGLAIGLIGCAKGLSTRGGAEGVGRSTTSAVVTIIFAVIILETLFTFLFNAWGV